MGDEPSKNNTGEPAVHFQFGRMFTQHSNGIFQPEPEVRQNECQQHPTTVNINSHIPIDVKPDVFARFIGALSVFIATLTLILVSTYTYYARGQWKEMIRAANAATNANTLAQNGIDQNLESARLEQRAWVGPIEIIPPPASFYVDGAPRFVKAFEKVTLGVRITNSGKSPALAVNSKVNLKFVKSSEKFIADYPPAETKIISSTYVLQPGMKMELSSLPTKRPLTVVEIEELKKGGWTLYLYGEITYDDIFEKTPHVTHFCLALSTDLSQLVSCSSYNTAD